jgi:putative hydrolase of the HAD superfamily
MMPGEPRHALFDLDDTIYPRSAGIMHIVSQRINEYMALRLGMDDATIKDLRPRYWKQYGTTMRGLVVDFGIDPDDYLGYVHDFSVADILTPNPRLDGALAALPWYKSIFTNASERHAQQVLTALGVDSHFERIFDIRHTGYVGKPNPVAYDCVVDSLGTEAQQCIAVDDSIPNLLTAKKMNMVTVLVGSVDQVEAADFTIGRIEDVAGLASEITRL